MVKRCVAGGCSNSATTDVSLHYFPVNTEIRAAWTTAVKLTRDGWDGPTKHSVLCSEHFPVDCFKQETSEFARGMMTEMGLVYRRRRALKADAIPTLFVSSSVKVSSKKNLKQAASKRNQAQQDAMTDFNDRLIICHSPTSDNDRTSDMSIRVNLAPSDASDCSMSENDILQNIGNPDMIKETADLQVINIPAADDEHQTEQTEITSETASDSIPEVVYLVGEENDQMDMSDVSGDPGEMDSGEDWQPDDELLFDDELRTESNDEIYDDNDDDDDNEYIPPSHMELCTDCGNFFRKEKPHTCEHKIKPISCNICGKRFVNELSLKRHTRVHDASYEVSCKCCHMKFKTKADKSVHEHTHLTEEKPFKCLDCSETFATYNKRKIHLKVHRGPKELKCPFCGLEFIRKLFQRHIVVHTGEKPYKCVVCERGFNQAGNLKSHMRLHTGERPYKCHHCCQGFNHNVSLKSHIKRYHTPGSENEQTTTNKRKHDSGDYQDFWDKDPDSCLVKSEQDTDDDVQLEETQPRKTKKNTGRRKGRPKRNKEYDFFEAEEAQEQSSDANASRIHKTIRTQRAQTSAETQGSVTQ